MNIRDYALMSTEDLRELQKTAGDEDAVAISSILKTRALMDGELEREEKQKQEETAARAEDTEAAGEEKQKPTRQAKQYPEPVAAALAAFRRNVGRTIEFYANKGHARLRGVIVRAEYDRGKGCTFYYISSIPLAGMPRKAYKKKASSPDILYISSELAPDDALDKVESIGKRIGEALLPEMEWRHERALVRSAVLPYIGLRVEHKNRTGRIMDIVFTDRRRLVEWVIALDEEFQGRTARPVMEYIKDGDGKIQILNKFQRVFPADKHTDGIRRKFQNLIGTYKRHKPTFEDMVVGCEGDIQILEGYLRLIQSKIDERRRLRDFAKAEIDRLAKAKIKEISLM